MIYLPFLSHSLLCVHEVLIFILSVTITIIVVIDAFRPLSAHSTLSLYSMLLFVPRNPVYLNPFACYECKPSSPNRILIDLRVVPNIS